MLQRLGCAVVGPEPTLDRGLAAARSESLDGALLDINLAGRTSYPIAEALRSRGVPFIFVSAYGVSQLEDGFRGSPVMEKPFSESEIEAVMARVFAAAKDKSDGDRNGA